MPHSLSCLAARMEATFVPCQLGVGHVSPQSPGSVASGSLSSPSSDSHSSEMKS